MLLDLEGDLLHDVGIGTDQVVPAHAGLARDTGGDDDELAARGRRVVVRARNPRIESFDRRRLPLIERFALGHAFDHIDEDDATRELFLDEALGGGGAYVAGADDGDLVYHGE